MEICSRCGSITGLGKYGEDIRMSEPSIPHRWLAEWTEHVMTKSYAMRDAVKSTKPGSVWLLWFFSQNACYHFEPQSQGKIALSRKFLRSEIALDPISVDEAIAELIAAGVLEDLSEYGSNDVFLRFSTAFLNTEAHAFIQERSERELSFLRAQKIIPTHT